MPKLPQSIQPAQAGLYSQRSPCFADGDVIWLTINPASACRVIYARGTGNMRVETGGWPRVWDLRGFSETNAEAAESRNLPTAVKN